MTKPKKVKPLPTVADIANPNFDDVMNLGRRWYYTEIREITEDAIERCNAEKHASTHQARDWMQEDVDSSTDGHQFVIYTAMAEMVLAVSDNSDAYELEMGSLDGATVEARACLAMRADVTQHLNARDDEWLPGAEIKIVIP